MIKALTQMRPFLRQGGKIETEIWNFNYFPLIRQIFTDLFVLLILPFIALCEKMFPVFRLLFAVCLVAKLLISTTAH